MISSTNGRCGSSPDWSVPVSSLSSASDPTQTWWSSRAAPDRQRGAPVAAAGERPVDVVVQPVAVAAVLDRLGVPVGVLVLAEQAVLDLGGADVPRRLGVVDERGVAAPAVRVAVLVGHVPEQQPALGQVVDEVGVGVAEELPADEGYVVVEVPGPVDRVDHRDAVAAAGEEVALTEGGGLVHQTGAVLGGDVVLGDHEVGVGQVAVVGPGRPVDQLEGPLVGPADHVGPAEPVTDGPPVAQCLLRRATRRRRGSPRRC